MKELLDQLRVTAERCKEHGEAARMTGIMLAVNDLDAYLTRCAPSTTPPTVEAFRKHEAVHGPWLRVREVAALNQLRWTQCAVEVFARYDGTEVIMRSGTGMFIHVGTEWQWSDADGNAVPGPE